MRKILLPSLIILLAVLPLLAQNVGGKGVAGGSGVFGGGGSAPVSRNFTMVGTPIVGTNATPASTSASSATVSETAGHLYYVSTGAGMASGGVISSLGCTDGTNTYTKVLGLNIPAAGFVSFPSPTDVGNSANAYLLSAPSTTSRTITCTWISTGANINFSFTGVEDWSYSGTGLVLAQASVYIAPAIGGVASGLSPVNSVCARGVQFGSLLIGNLGTDAGAFTAAAAPWTFVAADTTANITSSAAGTICPNFTDSTSPDVYANYIVVFH